MSLEVPTTSLRHALPLLAAAGLLPGAPATAATPDGIPRALDALYEVRTGGIKVAETQLTLESLGDGRFAYESRSRPVGVLSLLRDDTVVERSEWRLHEGRLRPLAYRYDRTRGDERRRVAVDFDWAAGKVENTAEGRTWRMGLAPGTLDKLSYVLVMMKELGDGLRDLRYRIADGGKVKTYRLTVTGEEELDTALGRFSTLKVEREREQSHRRTLLWCAEALGFLPVRIHHRERDGTVFELSLRRVEGLGRPAGAPRPQAAPLRPGD